MSILNTFKRALGFSGDDDEIEDYEETVATESSHISETSSMQKELSAPISSENDAFEFDAQMTEKILSGVLEVFNSALPDFLKNSIDPAAQRKELVSRLDNSIGEYMLKLQNKAKTYAEYKLQAETQAARSESDRLRKEMENLEQQKNNIREQQLSADRRRRALSDRVNDLEGQIAKVEAEREQFVLENRSLLNKIKLADIQPGVVEELQKEIERLKSGDTSSINAEHEQALASAISRAEVAEATQQQLEQTINDLKGALEQHKQLYTGLQEELTGERENRRKVEAQLKEAEQVAENLNQLEEQLQKVQTIINKRDEKIATLQAANQTLKDALDEAEQNIKALREAQEQNNSNQEPNVLDDDFECPNWFACEPDEEAPLQRTPDSDFGYQEPPRKPQPPQNEAQLSLF